MFSTQNYGAKNKKSNIIVVHKYFPRSLNNFKTDIKSDCDKNCLSVNFNDTNDNSKDKDCLQSKFGSLQCINFENNFQDDQNKYNILSSGKKKSINQIFDNDHKEINFRFSVKKGEEDLPKQNFNTNSLKPSLKKNEGERKFQNRKNVSIKEIPDVIEVENWKKFNCDEKCKEEKRRKEKRLCIIF